MHLATAVAAQFVGLLQFSDTTTEVVRVPQPPTLITQSGEQKKVVIASDFSTLATGRLALNGRQWSLSLSYTPSLTIPDVEQGFPATQPPHQPEVLQGATVTAAWHNRSVQLSLSESGSFGSAYYWAALTANAQAAATGALGATGQMAGGQPPSGGQSQGQATMPGQTGTSTAATTPQAATQPTSGLQPEFLTFASSNTSASATTRIGTKLGAGIFGGYTLNGGVTSAARLQVPEQYGPNAGLFLSYVPSRHDAWTTSVNAQELVTLGVCPPPQPGHCDERVPSAGATENLRHDFSPVTTLSLSAGAITAVLEGTTLQESAVLIVASGLLSYRFGGPAHSDMVGLSVGLVPTVDVRTGLPMDLLLTTASLSLSLSRTTRLTVTAAEQQSVPYWAPAGGAQSAWIEPYPFTSLTGTVDVRTRLDRQRTLGIGSQLFWEHQSPYGAIVSATESVSLMLTRDLTVIVGVQEFWQDQQLAGTSTSGFISLAYSPRPLRF